VTEEFLDQTGSKKEVMLAAPGGSISANTSRALSNVCPAYSWMLSDSEPIFEPEIHEIQPSPAFSLTTSNASSRSQEESDARPCQASTHPISYARHAHFSSGSRSASAVARSAMVSKNSPDRRLRQASSSREANAITAAPVKGGLSEPIPRSPL